MDIRDMFNNQGENNPDKVTPPKPGSILAQILGEIQNEAKNKPVNSENIQKAFEAKFGPINDKSNVQKKMDAVSDPYYNAIKKALNEQVQSVPDEQNPFAILHALLRATADLHKATVADTICCEQHHREFEQKSVMKSQMITKLTEPHNPHDNWQNIMAGLAVAIVNNLNVMVVTEGEQALKEGY